MWLIGMMGSGKTTVGAAVADVLGLAFYDTDRMVSERAGMEIPEIWETMGEEMFRQMEREAVASVPTGCVAAAGGGAVLDAKNRAAMTASAPIIWLRARPETLAGRVGGGEGRPLLRQGLGSKERLAGLLEERDSIYTDVATHVVDTDDHTPERVVDEVLAICQG